jgi:hypothetical protein
MSRTTGWPVVIELPRLPVATSFRYSTSCIGTGLSRPIVWRTSSISALPALGPEAKNTAGSPGSTRIRMKVTITTPSSAGMDDSRRWPTRRPMAARIFT